MALAKLVAFVGAVVLVLLALLGAAYGVYSLWVDIANSGPPVP